MIDLTEKLFAQKQEPISRGSLKAEKIPQDLISKFEQRQKDLEEENEGLVDDIRNYKLSVKGLKNERAELMEKIQSLHQPPKAPE